MLVLSKRWNYSDYAAVKIDPNKQSTKISIPCWAHTFEYMLNQTGKYLD